MSAAQSIPQVIAEVAAGQAESTAFQILEKGELRGFTYGEIVERAQRGAEILAAAGIGAGDRVVLLAENGPEWPISCLAALLLRATVVPLDPALPPGDLETLIDRADPRGLILSPTQLAALDQRLPAGLPVLNAADGLNPFAGYTQRLATNIPPTPDPDGGVALLVFTSGTTGTSKGVLLGHQALIHTAQSCVVAIEVDPDTPPRMLCVLPLHHITGFTVNFLGALLAGGTVTFVETLSAEAILAAMQRTRTTVLPAVPRLFEMFYDEIRRKVAAKGVVGRGLFRALGALCLASRRHTSWNPGPRLFVAVHQVFGGALQLCCSGAAPLPLETLLGLERLGFSVIEAYGMTETSGVATVNSVSSRRPGTVGSAVADVQIRLANPLPSTGEGEICIRGPILMRGYFRDPAATQEAVRDGWLHTGDLGRFDHQGHVQITGRLKDLIVTAAGKNAAPVDVENRYRGLEGARELAVFGMPSAAGYGEEIHAAAVPDAAVLAGRPAAQIIGAAVQSRAANVPSHLRIQRVHIVAELPKTTTLKVKRRQLKEMVLAGTAPQEAAPTLRRTAPQDETTRRVISVVEEVVRQVGEERSVALESTLPFELGIDSLGLIDLAARLESDLGVRLDERQLPGLYTVSDLVQAVKQSAEAPRSDGQTAPLPPVRGLLAGLALAALGLAVRMLWKFEVYGREHLPQRGAFVLCANHQSPFDILALSACLLPALRRTWCCFAKRELFGRWATRQAAHLVGGIPTDRDRDVAPAMRAGAKALGAGRPLLVHPEGTRTRTGQMGPFRTGAARLALETGAPLVPARIAGAYAVWPPHRYRPRLFDWKAWRRHRIEIHFGPLMATADRNLEDGAERQLTEELREVVANLGTDIER